ncbi:MAG TPA: hypothetical protein VMB79_16160 [Jatrophihabitans sp.]|nr:hypothetical protein [Jatrophihabitans sp.]
MTGSHFVTEPALWRSVGRAALAGLLVGGALEAIGLLAHVATSPVLLFGMSVAGLVLLQLVRVSVTDLPPPEPVRVPPAGTPERFHQLRALERRLDAACRDPANYDWSLRPMLVQLTADRLAHRHGIRIEDEPARARELLGEQPWQLLTTPPSRPVSRARLHELVQAISRL